jgi:polyisoprenyl-teichoic acid--peptidoglycan teichoic acid transferase
VVSLTPPRAGLGRLVGWTVLGTLLPGAGLVAAGRRRAGYAVLGAASALLLVLLTVAATGDPTRLLLDLALDPARLQLFAGLAVLGCLLLVLLAVATYLALLETTRLGVAQQAVGAGLAVALVAGLLLPGVVVTQYARIQEQLVTSVFAATAGHGARPLGGVRPVAAARDPWAGVPRVNVLLVGSDAGPDRVGVRTDTVVLASIDPASGDTVLLSLPRNLERVPFAAGTPGARAWPNGYWCASHECLLNAVWTWAEDTGSRWYPRSRYPQPGLAALEDAVHGVTGLPVDEYVLLDLRGFAAVVNALGGITVDVRERLPIGGSSENPGGTTGWIEPGPDQHLDGYHALWFARSRRTTNDYDRIRRQRCVIAAIADRAQPAALAGAFPALAAAAQDNLSTSIRREDLPAWVDLALRVKRSGGLRSLPLTPDLIGGSGNPDYTRLRELVRQALKPPPPAPAVTSPASAAGPGQAGTSPAAKAPASAGTAAPTASGTRPDAGGPAQRVEQVC